MKARIIRLKLADGTLVNGQININRDQNYDRVSDLITNNNEPFLILYNVTAHPGNIDNPIRYKTLFINKDHIIWAEPDEDQG
jgi:tartrate dehydratase beta subunit/fumarate hydratase class I family protein